MDQLFPYQLPSFLPRFFILSAGRSFSLCELVSHFILQLFAFVSLITEHEPLHTYHGFVGRGSSPFQPGADSY